MADEHRATAMAQRIIGRLGLQFGRKGRSRGTVVLAAPGGDLHTLPVAIVADLLRWRGFDVSELGANTPSDALAQAVRDADRLVAVGIASTTLGRDAEVARSVEAVRAGAPSGSILLGGSAIRDIVHARALGADIWTGQDGVERGRGRGDGLEIRTDWLCCPMRSPGKSRAASPWRTREGRRRAPRDLRGWELLSGRLRRFVVASKAGVTRLASKGRR